VLTLHRRNTKRRTEVGCEKDPPHNEERTKNSGTVLQLLLLGLGSTWSCCVSWGNDFPFPGQQFQPLPTRWFSFSNPVIRSVLHTAVQGET
jgi:hypothetical protein